MSRRASSGINPVVLIGVIVAVVALFFGIKSLMGRKKVSFEGTPPLPIEDFVEHGNSLRNNEYVIDGVVDAQDVKDDGRVVFLRVKSSGADYNIPVKIPADFKGQNINIEREQRYSFKIRIEKQGVPVALEIARL